MKKETPWGLNYDEKEPVKTEEKDKELIKQNVKLMNDNLALMKESEQVMVINLTLANEIERLKALIEEMFFKLGGDRFFTWQKFAAENNL